MIILHSLLYQILKRNCNRQLCDELMIDYQYLYVDWKQAQLNHQLGH